MLRSRLFVLLAAILAATCGCQTDIGQKSDAFEVPAEIDDGAVIVSLQVPEIA